MKSFLSKFSIFTIFIALVHFILETLFTIKFGQTFTGYLPDLIAVALLITGGYLTIKDSNAIGLLCGAWGFAFCLHYRSWAWRFNDVIDALYPCDFSLSTASLNFNGADFIIDAISSNVK